MAKKNRIKQSQIKRKPAKPKQKKTPLKKPVRKKNIQKKGRADLRKLIIKGVEELSLSLSPNQIDQFLLYFEELKKWNAKVNLTGIIDDKEIIIKHFLDSLSFLKGFSPIEGIRIIDVGTGAGFPGIPLKIYSPRISLTLVEASQKKCVFLHHICRLLELQDVNIVNERLENIKNKFDFIRQYNVFLSRAVADVDDMIKHGLPLLADRGIMIFSKGKSPETMIAGKILKGMMLLQIIPFTLPMSDYSRKLLVFQKI